MLNEQKAIYNIDTQLALADLGSSEQGLTTLEANKRLIKYGPNEVTAKSTPLWKRILEPFRSYFVVIILGAAILSIVEKKFFEAAIISTIVVINALIFYFQQFSASRVLQSLQARDKHKVSVLRDGEIKNLLSAEIVPGDVIKISEGMKVPADGRIIESNHIQADESVLTGESLPVHKHADAIKGVKQVYDQENMLFKGTYIKGGMGSMLVTSTGNKTQFGTINTLAANADDGKMLIESKIDDLTKKLLIGILIVSIIVFSLAVFRGIVLEEALRFTLSIVVSAVPEGLPVAMTLVLLFSAHRMAKQKALVKKIAAMETLGVVTLIVTDKTGTITKNKLSIVDTFSMHANTHDFYIAIRTSLNGDRRETEDPLDQILYQAVASINVPKGWKTVKEFPFDQQLRVSAVLYATPEGHRLCVKGAPEHLLGYVSKSSVAKKAHLILKGFVQKGYRTIAIGYKQVDEGLENLNRTTLQGLELDGLVALSDQLRENVQSVIKEAYQAGIRVVMLTGDHVETARYVAKQVGIAQHDTEVSTGAALNTSKPEAIRTALLKIRAFGRVLPEHKFKLLQATKHYEVTAMTGDGVNDIPALIEADVGFAMGSGTDATKDASDVVLMDSNFRTIISAIKTGRTVLANVRKMVVYLLGTSGGEVLTMLLALTFNLPLPITAVMVLWVNLVTDGVSVLPLGLSPSESRHMQQPPRDPRAPLLDGVLLSRAVVLALTMATVVLIIFNHFLPKGESYSQTAAFLALIVMQWANAFNMNYEFKSWVHNIVKPNIILLGAIGFSILVNVAVFMTPLKATFGLVSLSPRDAALAIVIPVIAALFSCDIHKLITRNYGKKTADPIQGL